jgi:hypothetical protein
LRRKPDGGVVRVFELAPPPVETRLIHAESEAELIAGIERGSDDIGPGLANVLNAVSRIAPRLIGRKMTRMTKPGRGR